MIKKLFLTATLALSGSLVFCAQEKVQPTQKEEVIANLTTGPVSARTEKLVRKLLKIKKRAYHKLLLPGVARLDVHTQTIIVRYSSQCQGCHCKLVKCMKKYGL